MLRALPAFAVGLLLIMLFAVTLGWLPVAGHGGPMHTVLPALTLALGGGGLQPRGSQRHGRGFPVGLLRLFSYQGPWPRRSFLRHGLRNASVPVVAYLGVQFVYLIEGVVVVETLFAWPGIGHALVHAIVARDVPMIQGTALVMGLLFVLLNTAVDIACHLLDPRRRQA